MVAFRNFSTLTAFLWEKPSHTFGLALFLDFKALWSVQCCWAGFLAAQKSFDRDWQAVEKVFDANSHVHAFNHWVVTEKKFPPKKLIQIHLRRRKAIKIDRKERKAWISSYLGQKSIFLCNGWLSTLESKKKWKWAVTLVFASKVKYQYWFFLIVW